VRQAAVRDSEEGLAGEAALDEEGVVMRVEAAEDEDSGVEGVDSEKAVKGGMEVEQREDADNDGAVDGRVVAAFSRGDVRRLSAGTIWLTNNGRRGEGAVDDDDTELNDGASASAGDSGMGQCGRSRTHSGDTRMDSGRLAMANNSESTDSVSTSAPTASRHSTASAYDHRSSSSLSLHWRCHWSAVWRFRLERGEGVAGGAEVQRVRLTCARGEMRAGRAVRWVDSKPMVGEMDSSAAGQAEVGRGGRAEEAVSALCLAGDLVEVDQPCCGVNVNRLPRAEDMMLRRGCREVGRDGQNRRRREQ